jgi:hypothetical protein
MVPRIATIVEPHSWNNSTRMSRKSVRISRMFRSMLATLADANADNILRA